ncbi:hypothetical protein EV356DRAFT_515203 [Viridothelium virens]|uniref:tRNA (adenine(58)-N(1))-methyltransferase catalytic subunit TRM61 n=1 Tax=Viridothelium virens TaxID=1048519 RepID=A0A6A6H9U5_VIRVR|nr:hypothetical protein EV356DRAFT_515203 [Viridothelium virens]
MKFSSGISCLRASRAAVSHNLNRWYSHQVYQEGDIVLLRQKHDASSRPILTKPLRKDAVTPTHRGSVSHSQIIGARVRDVARSNSAVEFRIHDPTLGEYTSLTPRVVTPIYPGDANLIVSLLDIHLATPGQQYPQDGTLEILEAGTGHGALTLYLARAIHGANTSPPEIPRLGQASLKTSKNDLSIEDSETNGEQNTSSNTSDLEDQEALDSFNQWKLSRRAILHTLDISPKHSRDAKKVVRNFRRGMYYGDIDFYTGDLPDWVTDQVTSRQDSGVDNIRASTSPEGETTKSFLSHAILDLPSAHIHLSTVADVLQPNGMLVVFNPSITQIVQCVERVKAERLPLMLDRVVELESGKSEGRTWDVRAVKTKVMERRVQQVDSTESNAAIESNGDGAESGDSESVPPEMGERDDEQSQDSKNRDQEYVMVCRPKVGERVTGGGFLGVWRKMTYD